MPSPIYFPRVATWESRFVPVRVALWARETEIVSLSLTAKWTARVAMTQSWLKSLQDALLRTLALCIVRPMARSLDNARGGTVSVFQGLTLGNPLPHRHAPPLPAPQLPAPSLPTPPLPASPLPASPLPAPQIVMTSTMWTTTTIQLLPAPQTTPLLLAPALPGSVQPASR